MDLPWQPSENAQMDTNGPIHLVLFRQTDIFVFVLLVRPRSLLYNKAVGALKLPWHDGRSRRKPVLKVRTQRRLAMIRKQEATNRAPRGARCPKTNIGCR